MGLAASLPLGHSDLTGDEPVSGRCSGPRGACMVRFVAAIAVVLACVPLSFLIGAVVLKLSGENWAIWSAGPNGWASLLSRIAVRCGYADRIAARRNATFRFRHRSTRAQPGNGAVAPTGGRPSARPDEATGGSSQELTRPATVSSPRCQRRRGAARVARFARWQHQRLTRRPGPVPVHRRPRVGQPLREEHPDRAVLASQVLGLRHAAPSPAAGI